MDIILVPYGTYCVPSNAEWFYCHTPFFPFLSLSYSGRDPLKTTPHCVKALHAIPHHNQPPQDTRTIQDISQGKDQRATKHMEMRPQEFLAF